MIDAGVKANTFSNRSAVSSKSATLRINARQINRLAPNAGSVGIKKCSARYAGLNYIKFIMHKRILYCSGAGEEFSLRRHRTRPESDEFPGTDTGGLW